jgi:hypothetical protein
MAGSDIFHCAHRYVGLGFLMTIKNAFLATGLSAVFIAASAHPISPDVLRPAPVRPAAPHAVANPDYLPGGTVETASMGSNFVAGQVGVPQLMAAEKQLVNDAGFKPGECGTLIVKTGGFATRPSVFITQTFAVDQANVVQRISSGFTGVPDNVLPESYLNAYDYAYRLETKTVHAASGAPISIAVGKLKTCP